MDIGYIWSLELHIHTHNYRISGRMPKFDMKILKQEHPTINCGNDNVCSGFFF